VSVHQDTLQGLNEILEYVKGDKTKARSMTVTIPDEEIELYRVYRKLSQASKHKTLEFVNSLLQAE